MSTVNVRSIDALEELQASLSRYADQSQTALAAVQREVQRTLEWLDERVRHWQTEVQRGQDEVRRTRAAYERCMASGDRDHPPSCGGEEQAIYDARRRLAQAEADARMAAEARKAVLAEAEAYQREAARLRALVQGDTPKAVATLRDKVAVLRSYAGGATGAATFPSAPSGASLRRDDAAPTGALPAPSGFREQPIQLLHPEIRPVALALIDLSDSTIYSEADFRRASREVVVEELGKLEQVQRWIEQGATDQWLWEIDQERGLSGAEGYHNVYRIFYSDNAIALEKVGNSYRVISGYEWLAVANELGWTTIPARVVG
jgi:hypothetical protein